jgi:hypothetical protein
MELCSGLLLETTALCKLKTNGGVQTKPGHAYVEMYVEMQKERGH